MDVKGRDSKRERGTDERKLSMTGDDRKDKWWMRIRRKNGEIQENSWNENEGEKSRKRLK